MGWAPIDEDAVREMVAALPRRTEAQRFTTYVLVMYMLCRARRSPVTESGIELQRGQLFCKVRTFGDPAGLSYQNVRTILSTLESSGEITISPTHTGSVITVCAFDSYVVLLDSHQRSANAVLTQHQRSANAAPTQSRAPNIVQTLDVKTVEGEVYSDITPDSESDLLPVTEDFDIQARMTHYRQQKTTHKARHNDLTVQQVILRLHQSKDVFHELGEQLTGADVDQIVTDWLTRRKPTQATGLFSDSPWQVPWWRVCLDGGKAPKGNGNAEEAPRGYVSDEEVLAMTEKPAWISTRRFLKLHPEMNGDPRAQAEDQTHAHTAE
jgi:hypothetical protein